ncbi:MAG: NAD-binding protein, partial [Pseudomonadota bacterium]
VLSSSTGSCWSVNSYCPEPGVGPVSPADRDYAPGFAAALMLKDMGLAQAAAKSTGQPTPLGSMAHDLYAEFCAHGGGDLDFSAILDHLRS